MPLTVLTKQDVKDILHDLSIQDVGRLQNALRNALHEYSTGTQESDGCARNQPERTVVVSPTGATTLFMPSTSSTGVGMKGAVCSQELIMTLINTDNP
jgi:hypothetical protein